VYVAIADINTRAVCGCEECDKLLDKAVRSQVAESMILESPISVASRVYGYIRSAYEGLVNIYEIFANPPNVACGSAKCR